MTAPARRKSRPWASSHVSRGRRDASDDCASGDAALVPDVEATLFLGKTQLTRIMLGSEQGGDRPAGPACVSSTTARGG